MLVDPFRLAIALIPAAAYLLLLALINLRRCPLLVAGGSDLAVLGLAISGFVLVGPVEMLRPSAATMEFGNYIWPVLLAFYGLWWLLVVLLARPRLVIYNASIEELHPVLAEAAARLDADSRWAGSGLLLPNLGVELHLDSFRLMRNVSLVASGSRQNLEGWHRLARELTASLQRVRVKRNPRAVSLLIAAGLLLVGSVLHLLVHPAELATGIEQVLAY